MTRGLERRVDMAEDALVIGADRQRFEQQVRRQYNLHIVSTEGLEVNLLCLTGGIEMPAWVQAELDRPIPHDAPVHLVREAEQQAQDDLTGLHREPAGARHDNLESVVASCFEHISIFAGRLIASFDDLRDWLSKRGNGPGRQFLFEVRHHMGEIK